MTDDHDLGDGPGPMTFGRMMALVFVIGVVMTLALIGLVTVLT